MKKEKKVKDVAVLFSGGLDSTYLVWKNLKEGNRVTPYYTEILNNTDKSRIEKQQMARIVGVLRQEFGDLLEYPRYASKAELWLDVWENRLKFKQTPIWLMSTLYMNQSHDEIQIGYVANDDSIPFLAEIKKTYKSMGWFLNEGKHRPELTFPIYQMAKFEMLDQLPSKLKSLIYSCEAPIVSDETEIINDDSLSFYSGSLMKFFEKDNENRPIFLNHEPCGNCDPCRKILTNHYDYYVSSQPIYKKLKMKTLMLEYDCLIKDIKRDEKTKAMFDDITRVHGYLNTPEPVEEKWNAVEEKWKPVELIPKDFENKEIIGGDAMASNDDFPMESIEKLENDNSGLARDHWTDVSFR